MRRHHANRIAGWLIAALVATACRAEVTTIVDRNDNNHATPRFQFKNVPPPSRNDAATHATFTIVYGKTEKDADKVDRLHDGKVSAWEDQPLTNFAFAGRGEGRLLVDLGRAIDVAQVNTYSWHPGARGPQVYKLFAADGTGNNFDPKPGKRVDPQTRGWAQIAAIDTWPKNGEPGGQYGVSTFDSTGSLGHFRYLLFDIARTRNSDNAVHTFYCEFDVIERGVKPAPVEAYWSPPARLDPPGDPMDWTPPPDPPALRTRYDPEKYARLAKAARARIDVDALRAPGRPTSGLLIQEVLPGQPAAKLGVAAGDILMSIDGAPLGSGEEEQSLDDVRDDVPQQLTFWSAHAGERTITIPPGQLGIVYYGGRRLADSYARSAQRDPKWDDDMLVAASTFMTNPLLAETALSRAQQAGYSGLLLPALAARVAFFQCRFDDALAWGWPAWSKNQRLSDDTLSMSNNAARLSFKLEQSIDLCNRYPQVLHPDAQVGAAVAAYRAMPKSNLRDPLAELDNVSRTRTKKLNKVKTAQKSADADNSDFAVSRFNDQVQIGLHLKSGEFMNMYIKPGFSNVALSAHFSVHDTDDKNQDYSRMLAFGVYDLTKSHENELDPSDAPPADMLQINLMTDGTVAAYSFGLPPAAIAMPVEGPGTHIEGIIRLIVLHNRCEVTLNDRRVFYGPMLSNESKRRYGFFIKAVGITGRVLPPVWERLDDPRTPTTAPTTRPATN